MSNRKIIEAIQAISETRLTDKVYIAKCNVESYNQAARTALVTMIDGRTGNEFVVNLMPEVDDSVLVLPTVGSTIWVTWSTFVDPFMSGFPSEFDMIIFNGGENGGFVLTPNLITKLNNIENLLNDLISKFNSHTHTGVETGGGVSGPTLTQEGGTLTPTEADDIQSQTILQ